MALSLDYSPRRYFLDYHKRRQRFAMLVAHRRAGKSYCLVGDMIAKALACQKPNPQYGYIAPMLSQARSIAWKAFKRILGDGILKLCKVSETRLSITLPNGAEMRLFGLDNPESLRGLYFDGVVLDECQDIQIELLSTVLIPALTDRRGWLTFSGTPKGQQSTFYAYYKTAQTNKDWFLETLTVDDTNILTEDDLETAKSQMSDEDFEQEFRCSWTSHNRGSIFATYLENAVFQDFTPDPKIKVHCVFDLGFSDQTSVWMYQLKNGLVDVVDFYSATGKSIKTIMTELNDFASLRRYEYGDFFFPHDAYNKNIQTGKSVVELLWADGYSCKKIPDLSVSQGINSARDFFSKCRFHPNTAQGVEYLRNYKFTFDRKKEIYSRTPRHDINSHASDSFRYLSLVVSDFDLQMSYQITPRTVENPFLPKEYMEAHPEIFSKEHIDFFYGQEDEDFFL